MRRRHSPIGIRLIIASRAKATTCYLDSEEMTPADRVRRQGDRRVAMDVDRRILPNAVLSKIPPIYPQSIVQGAQREVRMWSEGE